MNDDPLTLRLNGVDNLEDWPAKHYATMWVRKHAKADAKMGKGNKGNITVYTIYFEISE